MAAPPGRGRDELPALTTRHSMHVSLDVEHGLADERSIYEGLQGRPRGAPGSGDRDLGHELARGHQRGEGAQIPTQEAEVSRQARSLGRLALAVLGTASSRLTTRPGGEPSRGGSDYSDHSGQTRPVPPALEMEHCSLVGGVGRRPAPCARAHLVWPRSRTKERSQTYCSPRTPSIKCPCRSSSEGDASCWTRKNAPSGNRICRSKRSASCSARSMCLSVRRLVVRLRVGIVSSGR